jgi:hypothetical protein
VPFLIVEEHVRIEGTKKLSLVEPAKKQRLIDTYVPCTKRADHPLMGWSGTGCY